MNDQTLKTPQNVRIGYTNYRGERSVRTVRSLRIEFGSNEFRPESQWLLIARDVSKQTERGFAMKDIHSFGIN